MTAQRTAGRRTGPRERNAFVVLALGLVRDYLVAVAVFALFMVVAFLAFG